MKCAALSPASRVPAYNLGNFMRTLAMPKQAEPWSRTSLREKLLKIGAKVVSHGRYVTFQMAEARCHNRGSKKPSR
jgi:Transposase DDE domain group 1